MTHSAFAVHWCILLCVIVCSLTLFTNFFNCLFHVLIVDSVCIGSVFALLAYCPVVASGKQPVTTPIWEWKILSDISKFAFYGIWKNIVAPCIVQTQKKLFHQIIVISDFGWWPAASCAIPNSIGSCFTNGWAHWHFFFFDCHSNSTLRKWLHILHVAWHFNVKVMLPLCYHAESNLRKQL